MNKVFQKEQKIKFSHCDFAGIVFYPRFLEMLNELVEDWFEEVLDYSFLKMHPYNGIPTVNLNIKFKSPARLGDILHKTLWVNQISNRSVEYGFAFTKNNELIIEGSATLVNVNIDTDKNTMKSDTWNNKIKDIMSLYLRVK